MDTITPHIVELLWPYLEPKIISAYNNVISKTVEAQTTDSEWVSKSKALELLGVGATTLYNLCREGAIEYSYPSARKKVYNRKSIQKHLSDKAV